MIKNMTQIKEETTDFKFWDYKLISALIMVCFMWGVLFFLIGLYVGGLEL